MKLAGWLALAGKVDGGIAAAAAVWGQQDPKHLGVALLIAGIAGGIGTILTVVSRYVGASDSLVPGG